MKTLTPITSRIQTTTRSLGCGALQDALCQMATMPGRRLALLWFLFYAAMLVQPCAATPFQGEFIANLNPAREAHTATLLADGKMLGGGGIDAIGSPVAIPSAAPTFTDVSVAAGIFENIRSWGAAWGDYDHDGYIDVFTVGHLKDISQLWHNNGNGTFSDVTIAAGMLTFDGDCHGPSWSDLDNDGDLDLYVAKGTLKENKLNYNDLWRNDGNGTFANIAISAGVTGIDHRGRGSYAIDYDNDGDLDLFLPSFFKLDEGEANLLFRNDGNFQFTDVATEAGIGRQGIGNWVAAWSDYDLDGQVDFFLTTGGEKGGTPSSALFRNRGNGTFEEVSSAAGIVVADFSNDGTWGDFNNDGYPDLYVTTGSAGILYRNNGNGTFTDVTQESGAINTSRALGADWGDYDNDGYLDLYLVNGESVDNRLFRNNGDGTFTDVAASAGVTAKQGGSGSDASFIDYNNDGFLDLFICNGASLAGPYLLFKNNTSRNHWLKIELTGQKSNRDGVGARITLTAGKLKTYRQYFGQHTVAQNRIPVHFGLRGATTVKSIVIEWPSGIRQELTNVPVDQTIAVVEPNF